MFIDYILLAVSSVAIGFKNFFAGKSNAHLTKAHNIYTYNFFMFILAFVISVIIGFRELAYLNLYITVMGLLYAGFLVLAQAMLIKATEAGGISISSLFYACGFLVPTVFTAFYYREVPTAIQYAGIALLIVSFVITVEKAERANIKWFIYVFAALMGSGCVGVIQKLFGESEHGEHVMTLMPVAFLGGAILTFIIMPKRGFKLPSKGFMLTSVGSGVTLGLTNTINVYITGVLPGVIVFSCVQGGGIIASAVIAAILAKEKLSTRKIIGLTVGVIAICLVAASK